MERNFRRSAVAPGLPFPPLKPFHSRGRESRIIPVLSINYDFIPLRLESPKVMWVDLKYPAPDDMLVGTPVKLHLSPRDRIQTTFSPYDPDNSVFQVDDVIGSRVLLAPYKGSTWLPTQHEPCNSPMGWGYNMKRTNVNTGMQGQVKYGYGVPISYLEYKPVYASRRATGLETELMEEDWYRGTGPVLGW